MSRMVAVVCPHYPSNVRKQMESQQKINGVPIYKMSSPKCPSASTSISLGTPTLSLVLQSKNANPTKDAGFAQVPYNWSQGNWQSFGIFLLR